MNFTPKTAETFARELFNKRFKTSDLDWTLEHCKAVLKCCLILSKTKKVDKKSLKIASWLHDVGRINSEENHANESIKIIEKKFGKIGGVILDCIINHGSSSNPKTTEGKIFQLADKMSLLTPELFVLYAKEDKTGAIKFLKSKLDSFYELVKKFEF